MLVQSQRAAIKSLLVSYRVDVSWDKQVEQAGRLANTSIGCVCTFAFCGEKRYVRLRETVLDGQGVKQTRAYLVVYNGVDCRKREERTLVIQEAKSAYAELNHYTNALLWPMTEAELEDCRAKPGKVHFLPYFLEASHWRVLPKTEVVRGVDCLVLEEAHGLRRLWLDRNHAYALLRYECENPFQGVAKLTSDYHDLVEVLPDLYLPKRIETVQHLVDFDTGRPIGIWKSLLTVSELRVNDVPESLFSVEPEPGELVIDNIKGLVYRNAPITGSTLNESIERARLEVARVQAARRFRVFLVVIACFTIAGALGAVLARRRAKGKGGKVRERGEL